VAHGVIGRLAMARPLLLLLVSLPVLASEKNTEIISDPVYLKPQRLVTVENHRKLNIYCTGRGSPAVIFDSALGDTNRTWALVQPVVAAQTRACSYDRAGLGFSDPSPKPRTSANMIDDLHHLLQATHIKPPYILVGHSLGGMNIKLYAETYLAEVAGMVFVDPSHEDLAKKAWALDPERARKGAAYMESLQGCLEAKPSEFVAGSQLYQTCIGDPNPHFSEAINALEIRHSKQPNCLRAWISEQENVWNASADQLRAAKRGLGDMPLIVLTHEPLPRQGNESQEMSDAQNRLRTELHSEIARMSTHGSIRTVKNSGHYFQLEQPQEVSAAVLEVLGAASDGRAPRKAR